MLRKQLLIISLTWPEPAATAAGRRMLQLIGFFREEYHIIYASTASEVLYAADLSLSQIKKVKINVNDPAFDTLLREIQPQIVLFDRFAAEEQFGWRVAEFAPHALRILDTEDLHSLRSSRRDALLTGKTWNSKHWITSELAKREMAAIYRSDLSLIISRFEIQALTEIFKIPLALIAYVPYLLSHNSLPDDTIEKHKGYDEREDFVSIGTGKHAPNTDSLEWLSREIWPVIRKRMPEAKVHIYGSYLPENIIALHDPKSGFFIHGWVNDAREVIGRARVLLAPLRFGAGIKGKLVESMMYGTPSVTTETGIEGLGLAAEWGGVVAHHPLDLAAGAVNLYNSRDLWIEKQRKGTHILKREFFDKTATSEFSAKLLNIMGHLDTHRESNFVGGMLVHHRHASTKYLSKYIEEKNKDEKTVQTSKGISTFEMGLDTDHL